MDAFLRLHRQRIAKWMLAVGGAVLALLVVAVSASGSREGRTEMFLAVWLIFVGVGTATIFGAWKLVWFVSVDPPVRRSDVVWLGLFGVWLAWSVLGAGGVFLSG